jgi:predicted amidohydrolase
MDLETTVAVVQSGFHPRDYLSAEAFAAKVSWCFETIAIRGKRGHPRPHLVVFPECTGMWLPLFTGKIFHSLTALVSHRILSRPFDALGSVVSGRGASFVFLDRCVQTFQAWIEPFVEAARRYDTYVCPGSTFLPDLGWQGGTGWQRRGNRVWNTSCLINPQGRILGWTRKIHLSREERALRIGRAGLTELVPYQTELGRIGILVGRDGFYETPVEQLDRQDCSIVVMPSASRNAWMEPALAGSAVSRERQWLSQGLGSMIQGRENIRLAVNPLSVSWILDHREEGRSNVFVNRNNPVRVESREQFPVEYNGYPGLEVIASCCDCEEIISFTLEQ